MLALTILSRPEPGRTGVFPSCAGDLTEEIGVARFLSTTIREQCRAPPRPASRATYARRSVVELPRDRAGCRQRIRRGGFCSRAAAKAARAFLMGTDADPGSPGL